MTRKWPRLMVVDDSPDCVLYTTHFLRVYFEDFITFNNEEYHGYLGINGEVIGSVDGNTALRILREEGPFDLVLTDLMMEGVSGVELLTRIRNGETETRSGGTPRTVLVGAYSGGLRGYDDSGFDFAIPKPQYMEYLAIQVLKELMSLDSDRILSKVLIPLTLDPVFHNQLNGEHNDVKLTIFGGAFLRLNETGQTVYLNVGLPWQLANKIFALAEESQNEDELVPLQIDGEVRHKLSCHIPFNNLPPFRIDIQLPEKRCFKCCQLGAGEELSLKGDIKHAILKAFTEGKIEWMGKEMLEFGFVIPSGPLRRSDRVH